MLIPVFQGISLNPVLQLRNLNGTQILIKYLTEVFTAKPVNELLYLFSRNRFQPEFEIKRNEHLPKQAVIIHYHSNGMYHIGGFVIHVAATFFVYIVGADDGHIIFHIFANAADVIGSSVLSKIIIGKQSFTITGKSFMYPHVGNIFGSDIIGKPLVPAFVYNNEIPF